MKLHFGYGWILLCLLLCAVSCKTALSDKTEYENGWEFEQPGGNGKKPKRDKTPTTTKTDTKSTGTATANASLKKEIDSWLGVPYKYGGTTKAGVDCSAFCGNVFQKVYGISLGRSANDIYLQAKAIRKEELKEGDLVFFKINSAKVSHVGIYLSANKFAHASTSRGVMISDLTEAYWTKYYFASGRIKN